MQQDMTRHEVRAVEEHQIRMEQDQGAPIPFEIARADWLANHAVPWRQKRHAKMLQMQREEMLKYKWIESQKAHKDLGKEIALEWIEKHAAKWRQWYDENYELDPVD